MAMLADLWPSDRTVNVMAALLGVSRGAVTGKAARMGLPRRPSPIGRKLT